MATEVEGPVGFALLAPGSALQGASIGGLIGMMKTGDQIAYPSEIVVHLKRKPAQDWGVVITRPPAGGRAGRLVRARPSAILKLPCSLSRPADRRSNGKGRAAPFGRRSLGEAR